MAGASIQMGAAQVENLSEPNLHQKGMQMHEAQELALAEWIRLPTERDQGGFRVLDIEPPELAPTRCSRMPALLTARSPDSPRSYRPALVQSLG